MLTKITTTNIEYSNPKTPSFRNVKDQEKNSLKLKNEKHRK